MSVVLRPPSYSQNDVKILHVKLYNICHYLSYPYLNYAILALMSTITVSYRGVGTHSDSSSSSSMQCSYLDKLTEIKECIVP